MVLSAHAWAGIYRRIHPILVEIGAVLRRITSLSPVVDDRDCLLEFERGLPSQQWARSIERRLQSLDMPRPHDIVDCEDVNTPKGDLIKTADAYRFFGLLELCKVFPALLAACVNCTKKVTVTVEQCVACSSDDLGSEGPLDDLLAAIALHTLRSVADISISPGASRSLLLVMVSAGSQLRTPRAISSPH